MHFDMPAPGLAPYLTLIGITLLAALLPLLLLRKRPLASRLRDAGLCGALVLPFTAALGLSVAHNSIELRDGRLIVRASYFYEYARDIDDFDLARARQGERATLAPDGLGVRRNGIGLPGYTAGRFGGGNRESLFVAATDTRRMVYLPARQGQSLLISVERGDELLKALYRVAPARQAQLDRAACAHGLYTEGCMPAQ